MLSYLSRWARVLLSVRSLAATTSMSAPETWIARYKLRPIRPKPLMPSRTVTVRSSELVPERNPDPSRPRAGASRAASPPRRRPRCWGRRCPRPACRPWQAVGGCVPATASLVSGGSASAPSSSRLACLCSRRSRRPRARCSGTSSPRISSARSTLAPAATAARAERRRLASSKFASRLAVARTSRRIRRSSQASTLSWAPSRVSSAPIESPSRTTTRSTPRTSRALACTPSRRAAPTSASAASGPGQVISSADERPGSVSEPCARNAPRQAASASHRAPLTTCGGSPRTGRPRPSSRPVCRASASPSLATRTTYRLPRRSPPAAITATSLPWP